MRLEVFRGADMATVSKLARDAFGDEAMIIRTASRRMADGSSAVEIVAADANDVDALRRRLSASPLPEPSSATRAGAPRATLLSRATTIGMRAVNGERAAPAPPPAPRPFVLALVGPTGAGKTTTLAKLAAHAEAFGGWKVGAITIDTYRVGALEQLQLYAEVAGFPVEVVYDAREVDAAIARLAHCDVILVDTPGRAGARARAGEAAELDLRWRTLLRTVRPDETHLVLAAGTRVDVAAAAQEEYEPLGVTHLLLTKLDEVPEDAGLADLAVWLNLPARWVADGQEVPLDLRPGPQRIMASLGIIPPTVPTVRAPRRARRA
jgi:flagellar biosynthesis protein FlhF